MLGAVETFLDAIPGAGIFTGNGLSVRLAMQLILSYSLQIHDVVLEM